MINIEKLIQQIKGEVDMTDVQAVRILCCVMLTLIEAQIGPNRGMFSGKTL